ncbi:1-acyl-sn-glycerol-3-phosphate acyltransferase, partial [bacterium]|nr:1-acyl-sn-glycerol-3-phosphate acyltransferase [bacterium]
MVSPQETQFAYRFVREGARIFYALLYGLKFEGQEFIPQSGGAIIVSNHTSLIDPPLLAVAVPRRQVHFIAKKDLFEIPVIGPILGGCGCIWVDRDSKDGASVNQAVEYLENGHVVGIFPEGTRSKDGKLGRGKLGAAFIALKTGLPVVPACIFNAYE